MLKSLLFSLFLMLCLVCGSPLTRAAEDVRPEKPAPAESQTSTEDDRYKALLRRLDSIESNLKAKQHIDAALKKFDAQTQGQVSMLSMGFGALSFWATFLALAGVGITYFSSHTYIQSIKVHEAELKEILQEARKHRKILREMTAEYSPAEKFAAPVLAQAREAAAHGVGTEVLWGKAILAQEEERWQEALTYWQGVLETFPQDKTALFGASLAALQLSEKATGEERQRLWQTAEKHFKAYPKAQLTAAVLGNWGVLCQKRSEAATDSKERERWFNEAAEKYRKATEIDPDHASSWSNWGNICMLRGNVANDNRERETWYNNAEEKYHRATEIDPRYAANWNNWGVLYILQGTTAINTAARERWYAEAERKLTKALDIDPRHASSWFNRACLASLRQDVKTCVDALEQWRDCKPDASADALDGEDYFDNVRHTPEFQEFRKKLADKK